MAAEVPGQCSNVCPHIPLFHWHATQLRGQLTAGLVTSPMHAVQMFHSQLHTAQTCFTPT